MTALLIVITILIALVLLVTILLVFGTASLRITCREKVRVVASIVGIRFTLVSDKDPEKAKKDLSKCHNPDRILKKELRRRKRLAKKAYRKQLKAEKKKEKLAKKRQANPTLAPSPNVIENLQMITALIKKLYTETRGRIGIRVHRFHITVGSDDAAKTAMLYGVAVQSVSYLMQFIESKFNHIERKDGAMTVSPDYLSNQCRADVDFTLRVSLSAAIGITIRMFSAHRREKAKAIKKARARIEKKRAKRLEKKNAA